MSWLLSSSKDQPLPRRRVGNTGNESSPKGAVCGGGIGCCGGGGGCCTFLCSSMHARRTLFCKSFKARAEALALTGVGNNNPVLENLRSPEKSTIPPPLVLRMDLGALFLELS